MPVRLGHDTIRPFHIDFSSDVFCFPAKVNKNKCNSQELILVVTLIISDIQMYIILYVLDIYMNVYIQIIQGRIGKHEKVQPPPDSKGY